MNDITNAAVVPRTLRRDTTVTVFFDPLQVNVSRYHLINDLEGRNTLYDGVTQASLVRLQRILDRTAWSHSFNHTANAEVYIYDVTPLSEVIAADDIPDTFTKAEREEAIRLANAYVNTYEGTDSDTTEPATSKGESAAPPDQPVPADVNAFLATTKIRVNSDLAVTITPLPDYERLGWVRDFTAIHNGLLHVIYQRRETDSMSAEAKAAVGVLA